VRLSAVSAWIAERVVPAVRLIAFRFPGPGLLTTTMEHHGAQDPMALSLLVADGHQKPPG
jgi:hypothetical protein